MKYYQFKEVARCMTEWELARYLIDAKKCVDSIMFIEQNFSSLQNIDIREKINMKRDKFYINCCVILDKSFTNIEKKTLREKDEIIKRIYYERNKNSAHKDTNYIPIKYKSIKECVEDLKKQLIHLKEVCNSTLPPIVTLDFVPHDRELFRLINGLVQGKESSINKQKYPLKSDLKINEQFEIFHDTEDIRDISSSEVKNYATLCENGINSYEGLQNRQDFCIRTNVLHNHNMWTSLNFRVQSIIDKCRELGIIDKYDVLNFEALSNPHIQNELDKILKDEEHNE